MRVGELLSPRINGSAQSGSAEAQTICELWKMRLSLLNSLAVEHHQSLRGNQGAGALSMDALTTTPLLARDLLWLLLAALAAGLARGFSGFGHALIFVPLASVPLGLTVAAPLMWALEAFAIAALTSGSWRLADKREVGWLTVGTFLGAPIGVLVLSFFDALTLRWCVTLVITALLALLISGWRFRGPPIAPVTVGFGAASGALSSIAMAAGPPVIAYLLGRGTDAKLVRASFALFLATNWIVVGIFFGFAGLLTTSLLLPLVLVAPLYAAGIWGGTRMFGSASERTFRHACYGMIGAAALISMPLWDHLLR